MHHTWRTSHTTNKKNEVCFFNSFFLFFEFIFKFTKILTTLQSSYFFWNFIKLTQIFQYVSFKLNFDLIIFNFNNKFFTHYDFLKINTYVQTHLPVLETNEFNPSNTRLQFSTKPTKKLIKNHIFLNFLFIFSSRVSFFKHHHHYNLFYVKDYGKTFVVIDTKIFLKRWYDGQNFVFNIYYYNFLPLVFGSFAFKSEVLSLNWQYLQPDVNFWNYSFAFFIFRSNRYDAKFKSFLSKINDVGVNFFFVTNSLFHFKNLHYFNKFLFFSLGIVYSNTSPWILSYSLPAFSTSFLMEYFFIKFIIFIEKSSLLLKFQFFNNLWTNLILQKKFKNMQ